MLFTACCVSGAKEEPSSKDEDLKDKGFFKRPRTGGKSIWDWLNLLGILAIPLILGTATLLFGLQQTHLADLQHQSDQQLAQQQHMSDQQAALDQQRAAILQTYIDNIQDLLLNHNLLKSGPLTPDPLDTSNYDVKILARARTLTALQGLDPQRKGVLLQFLYGSNLIGGYSINCMFCGRFLPIIALDRADLSFVDLSYASLRGISLNGADLSRANLIGADLGGTDLGGANLKVADLIGAGLSGAYFNATNLGGASLSGAYLNDAHDGAQLIKADLRGAINLTQQQLDHVQSCRGATLPQGLTCHHNQ